MTPNQLQEALACNKAHLKCADHQPILEDAARLIALPILEADSLLIERLWHALGESTFVKGDRLDAVMRILAALSPVTVP